MPLVSVVIPVRNGENVLPQSLGSVVRQTLRDIEVIVVDDASTDGTRAIVQDFAATDPRIRYELGPGLGSPSAARNVGLDLASGEYLAFLDADDFFDPTMLERLYGQGREDGSDIVLTKFRTVDRTTGVAAPADWALRLQYFPPRNPFTPEDLGDHLFYAVNPAVWNKLFRTDFVRGSGLRFQALRRADDVYFMYMALALSRRLSVVEGYLIDYYTGNPDSLEGSLDEAPLEFLKALDGLSHHLREAGLFDRLERAYVNEAVEICLTHLRKVTTVEAFTEIHSALKGAVFERLGVLRRPPGYFLRDTLAAEVAAIMGSSTGELLFSRLSKTRRDLESARREVKQVLREVDMRANSALAPVPAPADSAVVSDHHADGQTGTRPDVSVVVPVHNTAPFLEQCISSILAQGRLSLELVCVDDGSTDASGAVLDRLASTDPRVVVIHQPNAGPSVARNRGIEASTGRYLCFVDSDDWWRMDGLSELVRRADADQLDLLLFDAVPYRDAGVTDRAWERFRAYYERSPHPGIRTGPEMLATMRAARDYRPSPCLYLIQADHFGRLGLRFYPGIVHEDNLFTFTLLLDSTRVAHEPMSLYGRRVRTGSIMTATSRLGSARGYLITYLEMLRTAANRPFPPLIATQVGAVIAGVFQQATENFSRVSTDVGDRLKDVDPGADAQAAVLILERLRYESQFKRGAQRTRREAPAGPPPLRRRVVRRLRSLVRRMRNAA